MKDTFFFFNFITKCLQIDMIILLQKKKKRHDITIVIDVMTTT